VNGVGERALAVCPRVFDGRNPLDEVVLDCFGSQWAGGDECVDAVLSTRGGCADPLLDCRWEFLGEREPSALLRTLDYLSLEVVYLVRPGGVRVYLPVWLGIPTAGGNASESTDGVLVRVRSLAELRALRARIRELKGLFGVAVEEGRLSHSEARACLLATLSVGRDGEPPATCRFGTHQLP
jgi:hypothetical protein